MPIIEGVEQGSADWLAMRTGIVTGSRVADVMAKLKRKDGEAAVRKNYKADTVCEILTGRATDHYISREMQWGLENEVFARNAYELHVDEVQEAGSYQVEGDIVRRVGFALHPKVDRFGASPDALVGKDGLAEFKCPTTATHLEYIIAGIVPAEYYWQMFAEMACAERQWCDFVSFDPRLPKRLQLFVRRLERDDARIAEMETEVIKFLAEVDALIASLDKSTLVDLDPTLETRLRRSLSQSGRLTQRDNQKGEEADSQVSDPTGPQGSEKARRVTETAPTSNSSAVAKTPEGQGRASRVDGPGPMAPPKAKLPERCDL